MTSEPAPVTGRLGGVGVPFPAEPPPGYAWLEDEPDFDPGRHLALEAPASVTTLAELGYSPAEIAPTATPAAVSAPFRILSDEGAEVMLAVARRLRVHARAAADRIERTVRGGCYRSRWLRDLCIDEQVTQLMSRIYRTPVAPHTMPLQLGHLNYEPDRTEAPVDKWHHDTIPLDYVMMVTDPRELPGGRFEYFLGTRAEAEALAARGRTPPPDRVVAPTFPGPGWAVALHGNMVVHRGAALTATAERITMVNAYVSLDRSRDDQSRSRDLIGVDDPAVLYAEWARHAAWRAAGRLEALIEDLDFGATPEEVVAHLEDAIVDVRRAIEDIRNGPAPADHYET